MLAPYIYVLAHKVLSIKLSRAVSDLLSVPDITWTRTVRGIGDTRYVGEPRNISCIHRTGEGRVCPQSLHTAQFMHALHDRRVHVCIVYVLCVGLRACIGHVWHARAALNAARTQNTLSTESIDSAHIFWENSSWYINCNLGSFFFKNTFQGFQISNHTEEEAQWEREF